MKRQILTIAAVLALVFAGAVFAQSANTTAPGPTLQQEPGLTNNNMPNPGNPVPDPNAGTLTTGQAPATDTTLHPETESTTGPVDVDVDTGAKAEGAVDVDVTTTPDADTDASGSGTETTSTSDDTNALPSTASDLPTVALLGLLALGAAFVLRLSKRNA